MTVFLADLRAVLPMALDAVLEVRDRARACLPPELSAHADVAVKALEVLGDVIDPAGGLDEVF